MRSESWRWLLMILLPCTLPSGLSAQTKSPETTVSAPSGRFIDHHDGTVTDRSSGLMWQALDGGEMTIEEARRYAEQLVLAGHDDWRLPLSMELFSIMDHRRHGPAMNTAVFPPTDARYWWTATPRAADPRRIWLVNTGGGIGAHAASEAVSAGGDRPIHVRCVRGKSVWEAGPDLQDNGNGTLIDEITGLTWQQQPTLDLLDWAAAREYCERLVLAGHDDWRMPTIRELRSLSDDRLAEPSFSPRLLPEAAAADWWSGTIQANRPERAWYLDSRTGLVTYRERTESLRVLAVRGGGPLTAEPDEALDPATTRPGRVVQGKKTKPPQKKTPKKPRTG